MDNTKVINVLSFCTGYAGIELGLSQVFDNPIRCVAVEIEAFAACNLVAKAEQGKLGIEAVYPDLKSFPGKRFRGCFDIITAGYPCQPFSHAGKRKGKADPRHLWPFIRDHIREIRPLLVICENVAGHLSLGFDRVVSDLDDLGYTTSPGIFAAEEIGAPHRRERLFIYAVDESSVGNVFDVCRDGRYLQQQGKERRCEITGEGRCELAHSESRRCGQAGRPGSGPANGTAGSGSTMDNADRRRHGEPEKEVCPGGDAAVDADSIMGNAECAEQGAGIEGIEKEQGSRRHRPAVTGCDLADGSRTSSSGQDRGMGWQSQSTTQWPARPGQPQYEWEQPRVILSAADYKILKGYVEKYQTRLTEGQARAMAHAEALYAPEPEMGRAPYGFTSRVDELRLLGNGVVPKQLAMAITELIEMMERDKCIK